MPGISTPINVNVKTTGIDKLMNQILKLVEVAEKLQIEIPINFDEKSTEEELKRCIDEIKDYILDEVPELEPEIDSILNTDDIKDEIKDVSNNIIDSTEEVVEEVKTKTEEMSKDIGNSLKDNMERAAIVARNSLIDNFVDALDEDALVDYGNKLRDVLGGLNNTVDMNKEQYNMYGHIVDKLRESEKLLNNIKYITDNIHKKDSDGNFIISNEYLDNTIDNLKNIKSDIDSIGDTINKVNKLDMFNTDNVEDAKDKINETAEATSDFNDKAKETDDILNKNESALKDYQSQLDSLNNSIDNLNKQFDDMLKMDTSEPEKIIEVFDNIVGQYDSLIDNANKFNKEFGNIGVDEATGEKINSLRNRLTEFYDAVVDGQKEADSLKVSMESIAKIFDLLNIKVPGSAKSMGQLVRLFKSLGKDAGSASGELGGFISGLNATVIATAAAVAAIASIIAVIGKLSVEIGKIKTQIGDLAKNGFKLFTTSIKNIPTIMNNVVNGLKSVGSTLASIGSNLVGVFQTLGGNIVNFFKNNVDLSSITDTFSNIGGDIASAISDGVVKSGSLMVLMTDEQRKHLASLSTEAERYNYIMAQAASIQGQWAGIMDSTNGRLYQMATWMNTLKGAVSQLANSLLSLLAPVIIKVVQLLTGFVASIAKIFGIDLSSSITSGLGAASKSISTGVSDLGKSAKSSSKKASKDIKKAADEIKRQVLSFDDVIQISDNNKTDTLADEIDDLGDVDTGGLGSLGDVVGGLTDAFGDLFDLELPDWLKELLELLKKGDFFGAGALLIQTLVDWLNSIDWDELGRKLNSFAKYFAEFLNGLFSNTENWKVIGKSFGKLLNTIVNMLETFADTFDFKQFGKSISAMLLAAIQEIDWKNIGETFYKYIAGVFDVIHEIVDSGVILEALKGIAESIREFFNNLTVEDAKQWGSDLGNAVSQALLGLADIIDGIDFSDIITTLQSALSRIINDGGIANIGFSIVNAIHEAISGIDAEQLGTDIAGLIDQIASIFAALFADLDVTKFVNGIIAFINELGDNDTIGKIIEAVGVFINKLLSNITPENMGDITDSLLNIVDSILTSLTNIIENIDGKQLTESVKTIFDKIREWFNNGGGKEKIQELVNSVAELLKEVDVAGIIAKAGSLIREILSGIDLQALLNEIIRAKLMAWIQEQLLIINNTFDTILNAVKIFVTNVIGGFKQMFDFISSVFKAIVDIASNIGSIVKGLKENIGNLKIGSGGTKWFGHATGGITNGTSVHFIGEAGREAILPLDRHTEWMDMLANRLNGGDNSGGNRSINIDFSSLNKPFYSRAELMEMGEIINDALNTYNFGTT